MHPQGGPRSAASRAAQKAVGLLIRPWETAELLKPGRSARRLHKPCRLHLKARAGKRAPGVLRFSGDSLESGG